jgi:hypothetical protein
MADNVLVSTVGGNETIAADEISSVKYQRTKLIYGPDGTNSGDVREADPTTKGPLPVNAYVASDYVLVAGLALTPKYAVIDAAISGDNTIVAAVSAKKIRVLALHLTMTGTLVTIRFESGAGGTALTGQMQPLAGSGITMPFNPVGWFETAAAALLNMELSGAQSVDGCLVYVEV